MLCLSSSTGKYERKHFQPNEYSRRIGNATITVFLN